MTKESETLGEDGARRLRVASYNIHSGVGRDGRYDPRRIVQVLDDIDADIVGLQEVDAREVQGSTIDQFEFLAEETGMHVVAGANIVGDRGRYGNALLSRWPVVECRLVDLSVGGFEPRGAICATVASDDWTLRVVNTHLGVRFAERWAQVKRLRQVFSETASPAVFLGDFNIWGPECWSLRGLGAPLHPARAPRTYPSRFPLLALDRIWMCPRAGLSEVRACASRLTADASDHLPVAAVVEIPTGQTRTTGPIREFRVRNVDRAQTGDR